MNPKHKEVLDKLANGPHAKALLKPNPVIRHVLATRFASMSPDQQAALKQILTPETLEPLKMLLPELSDILDRGMRFVNRGIRNGQQG